MVPPEYAHTDLGEAVADGSPLVELFGDAARSRILTAFLSMGEDQSFNVTQVAHRAGVSRSTVYDHLDDFLTFGIVIESNEEGGTSRYQLNTESEVAAGLAKAEWALARELAE